MNNLIDILKESLDEAKQVGTIYHFTDYEAADKIVNSDFKLKTSAPLDPVRDASGKLPDYAKYISFTRDKNLKSPTISRDVRFVIDGDALSNRYKTEPYADIKAGFGRRKSDESEERVDVEKRGGYVDIKPYLKSIDILDPRVKRESAAEDEDDDEIAVPSYLSKFNDLIATLKREDIPYRLVTGYLKENNNMNHIEETDQYCPACLAEYIREHINKLDEAEYKGRKVPLGKPMRGDIKKFKVYVKDPKTGRVVKVNFGFGGKSAKGKRMHIKVNNPKRRSAYRKRHHCDNPGPKTKANYWSCKAW